MKLTRLKIENFRSIQYLDLPIRDLNAFIGANSCGKSNILTALNLVIGSTYASIRSFSESDFFQRDPSNYILIEVIFQNIWPVMQMFGGSVCLIMGHRLAIRLLTNMGMPAPMQMEVKLKFQVR